MRSRVVDRLLGAGMLAAATVALVLMDDSRRRLQEEEEDVDSVTGHKYFWPLESSDILGLACATLGLMIAAGGGIGGGGMLVPIYVLVMGFKPKFAIPLSNFTVLGGAISNVLLNSMKRHPHADRPLVDWDLLLLMEPQTLAGALIGGFVNKLAPELLITVMLVLVLAATSDRTLKKAFKLYRKETEQRNLQLSQLANDDVAAEENASSQALLSKSSSYKDDDDDEDDEDDPEAPKSVCSSLKGGKKAPDPKLLAILDEERQTAPPWKVGVLLGMFFLIVSINVAKGGGAFPSPLGIVCGSGSFWLATSLMFFSLLCISFYVRQYLVERTAQKDSLGYAYVEGDFHWDATTTLKYPSISFFAGMAAGLFGIGGGIINGPLMLELGVLAPVASATTANMILLTSTTSATTFLVFGLVQLDYAKRLFWVGILATVVGQIGMSYVIKKSGRSSFVAFSIGAVVALSTVLMGAHGLMSLAYAAEDEPEHQAGICSTGD